MDNSTVNSELGKLIESLQNLGQEVLDLAQVTEADFENPGIALVNVINPILN